MASHAIDVAARPMCRHEPLVRCCIIFSSCLRSHTIPAHSLTRTYVPRYTNGKGEGNQLLPSTGLVPSGVTLGHFADMLAAQPRRLKLHWMSLHGHADWLRSADAVVMVPAEEVDKEESEG
jgi:hypothetical protein